jgi:hypothetical protein
MGPGLGRDLLRIHVLENRTQLNNPVGKRVFLRRHNDVLTVGYGRVLEPAMHYIA